MNNILKENEYNMIEASKFVIDKTINPAIELYNNSLNVKSVLSEEDLEEIKQIRDQSSASKVIITRFKKTGDLYLYLKKSIETSDGKTKNLMNKFNLTPYEDILDDFENKFKEEINDYSELNELVIGDVYTTYDFVFLAGLYRAQVPGILGVKDYNNETQAVIARGEFEKSNKKYKNEYLSDDKSKIKYYLISGRHKYNRFITQDNLDVYFFETIDSNKQEFIGVFELKSFNEENNYVILQEKKESSRFKEPKKVEPFPKKQYRNPFKISQKTSGGHSNIGQLKEASGLNAEKIVSEFLRSKNIDHKLKSAQSKTHRYDIEIKELVNIEVKNISKNKSFYLSDSQIYELKTNNTRLCLVDIQKENQFIYISKPYLETIEVKKILCEHLELKKYALEKYKGRLRIDSIEIGIIDTKNSNRDLYQDFELVNSYSKEDVKKYLNK